MERKKKYRFFIILLLIMNVFGMAFYYTRWVQKSGLAMNNIEQSTFADVVSEQKVMPVGRPVGLYIHTEGVLVIDSGKITDMNQQVVQPSANLLKSGDYIICINGMTMHSTDEVQQLIEKCQGKTLHFRILRDNRPINVDLIPAQVAENLYKAGLWLRDDTQGIGTITYVTESQKFGALGHGITDTDIGELMYLGYGRAYLSKILTIVKGENGHPGEIVGTINYERKNRIGEITENTDCGIFGTIDADVIAYDPEKAIPAANGSEVEKGPAKLLCSIGGDEKLYDINIVKCCRDNQSNKDFTIEVTDPALLEQTNGILQGMSGSPVLQNGKIIGAVTHVFVNEPTKGYGIFIEKMLKQTQ